MLPTDEDRRIDVSVVCGGRWHDFDHARREILGLLSADDRLRATVASDHHDLDRLDACELLVTYTCDLRPTPTEIAHLQRWVEEGGTWLALHGTNTALDRTEDGYAAAEGHDALWHLLGSRFLAHPPIEPYRVEVVPDHPLTQGIDDFTTADELYLMDLPDPSGIEVLASTRYTGLARGFTAGSWPDDDPRPVLYVRTVGRGRLWYCTLGHCRGRFDMAPEVPRIDHVQRGSWDLPPFRALLDRALHWALTPPPPAPSPPPSVAAADEIGPLGRPAQSPPGLPVG